MPDTSNAVATRSGCMQQDEIDLIKKELRQLEKGRKATSHSQKRGALLRRLNSVQSSTGALPSEILSLIFQHVHGDDTFADFIGNDGIKWPSPPIWRLGRVSSYWRQVLWSTPRLWSKLNIDISRIGEAFLVPSLLQLYLQNSRGFPFALRLSFDRRPLPSLKVVDGIAAVLFHEANAARIRWLCLRCVPWTWAQLIKTSNFSSLECFKLPSFDWERKHPAPVVLDLARFPCLHEVALGRLPTMTTINLCWSKVTTLRLSYAPINLCLKLLANCPNLINFSSIKTGYRDPRYNATPDPLLSDTITSNHLKGLTWTPINDPYCLAALQRLRLPVLRDLYWCGGMTWLVGQELAVDALLPHFPSTLSSLTLNFVNWTTRLLMEVFKHTGCLEKLVLIDCESSMLSNILSAILTPDWDTADHLILLPLLKSMIVEKLRDDGPNELPHLILGFLRNHFWNGCSEFFLEIDKRILDRDPEVHEGVRRMREEGFKLEIHWRRLPGWALVGDGERGCGSLECF